MQTIKKNNTGVQVQEEQEQEQDHKQQQHQVQNQWALMETAGKAMKKQGGQPRTKQNMPTKRKCHMNSTPNMQCLKYLGRKGLQ